MKKKPTIKSAAIKSPKGTVITKAGTARHKDVAKKAKMSGGTGKGKRGFVLEGSGKFVGRQEAKAITGKPKKRKRGTHSEDLWTNSGKRK